MEDPVCADICSWKVIDGAATGMFDHQSYNINLQAPLVVGISIKEEEYNAA